MQLLKPTTTTLKEELEDSIDKIIAFLIRLLVQYNRGLEKTFLQTPIDTKLVISLPTSLVNILKA